MAEIDYMAEIVRRLMLRRIALLERIKGYKMDETDCTADISYRLAIREAALPERIKGYSEEEIEAIQSFFPYPLPLAFRQFLKAMGHGAGEIFWEDDLQIMPEYDRESYLDRNKHSDETFVLPDDAFVFAGSQGCVFYYFLAGQGLDDPLVYVYGECDKEPTATGKTFSEFLMSYLAASLAEAQAAEAQDAEFDRIYTPSPAELAAVFDIFVDGMKKLSSEYRHTPHLGCRHSPDDTNASKRQNNEIRLRRACLVQECMPTAEEIGRLVAQMLGIEKEPSSRREQGSVEPPAN